MRSILHTILLGVTMLLGACANVPLDTYKNTEPTISFDQYFNGPVKAWGIVQDRKGKVIRRFDIDMVGAWNGNDGILQESFHYYDGERATRVWHVKKTGPNTFTGQADDIIGTATGDSAGNAIKWNYTMRVKVGNSQYDIKFDDWMFQMHDNVIMNRSYMKKFGLRVGEITVFMQKQ